MNPDFLKYLQQITSALRGGLVFNPLDELQKRAQQYGEGVGNQIEHDRAVAGYARSHPESQRAQQQNMLNSASMALGVLKPEAGAEFIPKDRPAVMRLSNGTFTEPAISHADAAMSSGQPLDSFKPSDEMFITNLGRKVSRKVAEQIQRKADMLPQSVQNQMAARNQQAGRVMGMTAEDVRGKLYANRGTTADEPMTLDDLNRIMDEKNNRVAPDSVTSAAIKIGNKIYSGHGHWDATQNALDDGQLAGFYEPGFDLSQIKEGFVTKNKPFVSRDAAARIARQNGTARDFNGRLPKLARTTEGITGLERATPESRALEKQTSSVPEKYGPTRTTIGPNDPVPPFWGTRLHSALTDNGGFTINPETGADLTSGYSVGGGEKSGVLLKKPLADLKPTELQSFLNANRSKLQPGQAWGGWVDNGQVYVEPADQVADLNEAQRLGNERGEQAIWDHANKTEIPLKAGKAGARQADQDEFSQVMDKWHSAWNDFESARDARNVASSRVKDVHDAISAFPEQRRQSLLNALRNPSTSETPWLSKYVQQDIPRPNGASPDKIADVEDIAYKTFNTPQFKKWLAAGQGTGTWYDTRETMGRAIDALGEKLGPQAFNQFIDHLAASTAMSRPENNIRRASWWRALNLQGLLNPEELRSSTLAAPEGMGHIAQRAHHFATADLVENGTINALANPKPAGFAANLKMNQRPVTFDTRMSNAAMSANPDMSLALAGKASDATPRKWAYAPIERAAQRVAAEAHARGDLDPVPRGVDPTATWQAQVWGGVGRADKTRMMSVDNPSFHAIVDQLLARSAKLWGVSPAKANELFWKGQPLDLPLDASLLKGPARKR